MSASLRQWPGSGRHQGAHSRHKSRGTRLVEDKEWIRMSMWQSTAYAVVNKGGRRHGPRRRAVDPRQEEEEDFFCLPQSGTWARWFLGQANGPWPGELFFFFSFFSIYLFSILEFLI
jgi:hypothetical protein